MAQEKYERERRISIEDVPSAAISFLDSCEFDKRIRWHEEESLTGRSIEANVKEAGLRYSIEFDTLGRIEGIEINRRESQLPEATMLAIHQYLDQHFDRYRIKKIQVQWTGNRTALISLVTTGGDSYPPHHQI